MTRNEAWQIVTSQTENGNLIKHMLAVEAAMGVLAKHFGEDEEKWKVLGLIHDSDYEKYPDKHPLVLVEELEKQGKDGELIQAIKSHAWGYQKQSPEPKTKMEWSLYCCDELTGFIVAVTLIRPSRKINDVTVENILSKWTQNAFAKGVNREQIEMCREKLGIQLNDFISITLKAMQDIHNDLGL